MQLIDQTSNGRVQKLSPRPLNGSHLTKKNKARAFPFGGLNLRRDRLPKKGSDKGFASQLAEQGVLNGPWLEKAL